LLTQERLKEVVHYDPETGLFTRKKDVGKYKKGEIVGYTNGRGWLRFKIDYKHYKLHRLAFLYMTGKLPEEVDHINGVKWDNRWCNLREATRSLNAANIKTKGNSKTGYQGVTPSGKEFKAVVTFKKKQYFSENFKCPKEAHEEYKRMKEEIYGVDFHWS